MDRNDPYKQERNAIHASLPPVGTPRINSEVAFTASYTNWVVGGGEVGGTLTWDPHGGPLHCWVTRLGCEGQD